VEIEDTEIIPATNSDTCILKVRAITIKINWTGWWVRNTVAADRFWCCVSLKFFNALLSIGFKTDSVDDLDTDEGKDGFVHMLFMLI